VKVHIVLEDMREDWVIYRLAKYLSDQNGWTMGQSPAAWADCNLFFPYLCWRFSQWTRTASAAFFTHLESGNSLKEGSWQECAKRVSLRVTMAEQYVARLEEYGPTINITPPVDLGLFKPAPRVDHPKPVVGTSGIVYKGGRKGEKLVARLAKEQGDRYLVKAAGKGWVVPVRWHPWQKMGRFYQGLDAFLCTSLIEGGPVTVLEALACGRPVVIPKGVGLCDELPDVPGIWRYKAGDYGEMVKALDLATTNGNQSSPEYLHSLVADRTVERYAGEWDRAVRDLIRPPEGKRMVEERPAWKGNSGVYLVAYAKSAHDCAYYHIKSIKKHNPDLPVCLACEGYADKFDVSSHAKIKAKGYGPSAISDGFRKLLGEGDHVVVSPMKDRRARSQKTHIWDLAPKEWTYILYTDVDMLCVGRLDTFFEPLEDGWDMVVTVSPPPDKGHPYDPTVRGAQRAKYKDENAFTNGVLGSGQFLQFAGGAWAIRRSPRTESWCRIFHQEWKRYGHTDQQAMMRAFWRQPLRVWVLGYHWNTFVHRGLADKSVGLLHFATAARAWTEKHEGRRLWREYVKQI